MYYNINLLCKSYTCIKLIPLQCNNDTVSILKASDADSVFKSIDNLEVQSIVSVASQVQVVAVLGQL